MLASLLSTGAAESSIAGTTLFALSGADPCGASPDEEGRCHKIPQRGIVVVEDDVEIGASTAIDRVALAESWLEHEDRKYR